MLLDELLQVIEDLSLSLRQRLHAHTPERERNCAEYTQRKGENPDRAYAERVDDATPVTLPPLLPRAARPFDVVGISTVAGAAHSADLIAGETSAVLVLPGRVVRGLFAERPALALAAMARLGELLAALTTELEELRSCELDQRLLACLRRHGRTRRKGRAPGATGGSRRGRGNQRVSAHRARVTILVSRKEMGSVRWLRRPRRLSQAAACGG